MGAHLGLYVIHPVFSGTILMYGFPKSSVNSLWQVKYQMGRILYLKNTELLAC